MSALDPSTHFGFWAWKKGTGKSFLFGRRSWKKRYFVLDRPSKMVSYWESQSHQTAQSPPLKPPLSLEGATVELPDLEQGRDKEGRIVFPFTLKFPVGSNSDKSEMRMRAEDKATREAIVAFLQKCGVKVVGEFASGSCVKPKERI
jgi:PH domain